MHAYVIGVLHHYVKSPAERCTVWETHYAFKLFPPHMIAHICFCVREKNCLSVYISIKGTWASKLEQIISNIMYVASLHRHVARRNSKCEGRSHVASQESGLCPHVKADD